MKSTVIDFDQRAMCLRIVPQTGDPILLTHHVVDLKMGNGNIYKTLFGHDFTGYAASAALNPGVFDLEGVLDLVGIGRDQIASGVYDNARAYLFATNWATPVEDEEPITASILGKATLIDDRFKIEEMSLIDALNQSTSKTYGPMCAKKFGGQEFGGCKKDLSLITVAGSITSVTSAGVFRDDMRGEVDDYFALGSVQFTTGPNANLKPMEVKSFTTGTFQLFEPFYYLPRIGDEYVAIPGCRKTLQACNAWNNTARFGGFPDVPTSDIYMSGGKK